MTPISILDQLRAAAGAPLAHSKPPSRAASSAPAAPVKRTGRPRGAAAWGLPARVAELCAAEPGPWTTSALGLRLTQLYGRVYSRGAVNSALHKCWEHGLLSRTLVLNERIPQKSGYTYVHRNHAPTEAPR